MRVVAVDDHRLVYDALEAVVRLIDPACDLQFAASLEEALALMSNSVAADLVLMDLGLPDSQGLVTLERFRSRFPEQPVVVVSGIDERDPRFQETVLQAINEYRAMGFIPKSHDRERGILALRHVLAGNIYFPREAAHSNPSAGGRSGSAASDPIVVHPSDAFDTLRNYGFTEGQLRVARLLLEGDSNKEIARKLSITDHTVKAHAGAIFDTLQVKTRLQAVVRLEKLLREAGGNTH
jgi:DNA-binding NarL/FixJ family response regulator